MLRDDINGHKLNFFNRHTEQQVPIQGHDASEALVFWLMAYKKVDYIFLQIFDVLRYIIEANQDGVRPTSLLKKFCDHRYPRVRDENA